MGHSSPHVDKSRFYDLFVRVRIEMSSAYEHNRLSTTSFSALPSTPRSRKPKSAPVKQIEEGAED